MPILSGNKQKRNCTKLFCALSKQALNTPSTLLLIIVIAKSWVPAIQQKVCCALSQKALNTPSTCLLVIVKAAYQYSICMKLLCAL